MTLHHDFNLRTVQVTMRTLIGAIDDAEQACAQYCAKGEDILAESADQRAEQHRQDARQIVREVLGVELDDLARRVAL